jgi:hypothetical protein
MINKLRYNGDDFMNEKAISIIFDGPPGPEPVRFVDVETDAGKSIKIGEWLKRDDGFWALRITELSSENRLTPAESVYGFAGWLTSRDEAVTISAKHNAAIIADLVNQFCFENGLEPPRDGWTKRLIHPGGEACPEVL